MPVPIAPKPVKVFTNEEIKAMFAFFQSGTSPTGSRDAAILATQLFGARRAGEVLALEKQDITILAGNKLQIRIRKSKTDQRGEGLFFVMPKKTALGVNPAYILAKYVKDTRLPAQLLFPTFDTTLRQYTARSLTVRNWNKRLAVCLEYMGRPYRSSHAIRATAISLSRMENVHAVAQVGGWKSLDTPMTIYRRTTASTATRALAQIGSRTLNMSESEGSEDSE